MKISWIVPTRNRPDGMNLFVNSVFESASNPDSVEIVFYIDNDDLPSKERADKLKEKYNINYIFGKRIFQSQTINECCKLAKGDIFFLGADDILVETDNWDNIVVNAFDKIEDKIALFYGYDNRIPPKLMGTHPIIHRKWYEVVGHIFPPNFDKGGSDIYVNRTASKLNRQFFLNIYTPHLHPVILLKRLRNILLKHNKTKLDLKRGNVLCNDVIENNNIYLLYNVYRDSKKSDTYTNRPFRELADNHHSEQSKISRKEDQQKLQEYINLYQANKLNNFVNNLDSSYNV